MSVVSRPPSVMACMCGVSHGRGRLVRAVSSAGLRELMTRIVRLRPWQKAAFDRFVASDAKDFLAVATPGAGKTTFALTAARHMLARQPSRLVVVAPTAHLKVQWARPAAAFSLHLDPAWSAADGALAADMHGIVTSYQQVATSAGALARLAHG